MRRLVADFNLPLSVVGVPTVREPDGLAMSSRNRHLNAEARRLAPCLYQLLLQAREKISSGENRSSSIVAAVCATLPHSDKLKLEYLQIVDPETMQPVDIIAGPVRIAAALWVGTTRLIDNLLAT